MKNRKTLVFPVCYLAYAWIYVARLNLSVASPQLINKEIISTDQIGVLSGTFFIIFALGRLINGKLSDKTAPYLMISAGLFFTAIGNIFFGIFPPFVILMIMWGVNAFAQSMLWSSVLCAVTAVYGEEKAPKMMSFMITTVAFGNIAGIVVNSVLVNKFGFGAAFIIPGIIALFFSILSYFTLNSIPKPTPDMDNEYVSFVDQLANRTVRNAAYASFAHGVIKDNITVWMVMFFVNVFDTDLSKTSGFVLFIPIVGFIGRIVYPLLYKLFKENEHLVALSGFIISAVSIAPLLLKNKNMVVSLICLGVLYAAVSLINTSMISIFPLRFSHSGNVASVSGLMDFATYLGAGVGSLTLGYAISKFGFGTMFALFETVSVLALFPIVYLFFKCGKSDEKY